MYIRTRCVKLCMCMYCLNNKTIVYILIQIFNSTRSLLIQDLPDIEGDKKCSMPTFATRYGIQPVSRFATGVLSMAYILAMCMPFVCKGAYHSIPMVVGHGVGVLYILSNYARLDESVGGVKKFYKSIWTLFYFEYLLYPFI